MTCIERFLDAVTAGAGVPADLYAPDAQLDATVPGWRFAVTGRDAIAAHYASWFADPARFEELDRRAVDGGEIVRYFLAWVDGGVPHGSHHSHLLLVDGEDRITSDTVFCGGRWDAGLLAQMADAGRG